MQKPLSPTLCHDNVKFFYHAVHLYEIYGCHEKITFPQKRNISDQTLKAVTYFVNSPNNNEKN